jgi:hypothetical protein
MKLHVSNSISLGRQQRPLHTSLKSTSQFTAPSVSTWNHSARSLCGSDSYYVSFVLYVNNHGRRWLKKFRTKHIIYCWLAKVVLPRNEELHLKTFISCFHLFLCRERFFNRSEVWRAALLRLVICSFLDPLMISSFAPNWQHLILDRW